MHTASISLIAAVLLANTLQALAIILPNSQSLISTSRDTGRCSIIRKQDSSFYIRISCHTPSTRPLEPEHTIKILDKAARFVASQPWTNFALKISDTIWTEGNDSFGGQDVVGLRIGAASSNTDGSSRNVMTVGQMGEAIEGLQRMYQNAPYQSSLFSFGDDMLGPLSCGSFSSGPTYPNEHLRCWDESDYYCGSGVCGAWLQA